MKSYLLATFFSLILSLSSLYAENIHKDFIDTNNPLPVGVLDKNILSTFIPQIMEEVAKEFKHQKDDRTRRDTREYGYSFFKMLNNDFSYDTPPEFFQQLGKQICRALGHEAPDEFTNIILSVYKEGFRLEPHVDVSSKNLYGKAPFYFNERVYGIVIQPDPTGHLYFAKWEGNGLVPPMDIKPVFELEEETGTIFCLEKDLRYTPYFHGVSPISNGRISITFRTVEKLSR